ncbi:MAG: efflux RND transporter periplasmic adaptor subunit [Patescibacteria group bacterium]
MSRKTKIIATVLVIAAAGGGYYYYAQRGETEEQVTVRQTATVERGLLVSSVSGTGQVQVLDSVDLKPGAAETVTGIYVQPGDTVAKGQLLVRLDASDVAKSVRDAETNLETAKQKLTDLYDPPTELQIMQKENSLISAQESVQDAKDDLATAYEQGYNEVTNIFLDLPSVMTDLDDILNGNDVTSGQSNVDAYYDQAAIVREDATVYKEDAIEKFTTARNKFDANFSDYKSSSRFAADTEIQALMNQTYETVLAVDEASRAISNLVDFVENALTIHSREVPNIMDSHQSSLKSFTGTLTNQASSLLSQITSLRTSAERIVSAERTRRERELELAELQSGPTDSDVTAQELTVRQREDDVLDAKAKYADYVIYAPFAGIVADIGVTIGQDASSGTAAVTLITEQQIAEIQFNEVDVTGIKVGQKANIEFDAIDDFTVTGEVSSVDLLGSASQGVVTFGVTVAFDSADERIKPGMSLSVNIVTDVREDVLTVSNSAIKYLGTTPYVEVVNGATTEQRTVTLGVNNDLKTEVLSGLEEGEEYVTSSTSSTGSATSTGGNAGGGFMVPGMGAGMMR